MALIAVLVLAWLVVLLRNYEVGRDGLVNRDPEQVESARLLDPNRNWELTLASVYLLSGDSPVRPPKPSSSSLLSPRTLWRGRCCARRRGRPSRLGRPRPLRSSGS